MNNQYFFMFSSGCYSDYCAGGLYVCDHEVTVTEWNEYYKQYQNTFKVVRENAMIAFGERTGCGHIIHTDKRTGESWTDLGEHNPQFWYSDEREQVSQWEQDNNPEETFRKLHNMQPVHYEELWRD